MVKIANESDKKELYNLWKTAFASQDAGFINYFFEYKYNDFLFYNVLDNEDIVSSIASHKLDVVLGNKTIKANYLTGSFTLYKYQRLDYHEQIMNRIIEDYEYQDLIFITKSNNSESLKKYGFTPISKRYKYNLRPDNLVSVNSEKVVDIFNVEELYDVHHLFYSHFDCHNALSFDEFSDILNQLRATHKKILVAKNEQNKISGYIVFKQEGSKCLVDEVVYFTGRTLMTLLNKLFERVNEVDMWLSNFENVSKMLKNPTIVESEYVLVRINDLAMFNRLYGKMYSSTLEAISDMINRSNLVIRY